MPAACQNRAETGDIELSPDDEQTGSDQESSRLTRRVKRPSKQSLVRGIMRHPLVIRRADRGMMLSWTKSSGVTCCAGQKMKFAASAENTDGTHPRPAHSDSGS